MYNFFLQGHVLLNVLFIKECIMISTKISSKKIIIRELLIIKSHCLYFYIEVTNQSIRIYLVFSK